MAIAGLSVLERWFLRSLFCGQSEAMEDLKILVIEHSDSYAMLIESFLSKSMALKFSWIRETSLGSALNRLNSEGADAVLIDLCQADGSEDFLQLRQVAEKVPDLPIVVLTSRDDPCMASRLIRLGAQDTMSREKLDGDLLNRIMANSIQRKQLEVEIRTQSRRFAESQEKLKSTVETLEVTRALYCLVTESAYDAIFTFTDDEQVIFANHAAELMFGYTRDEMLGQSIRSLIPDFFGAQNLDISELRCKNHDLFGKRKEGHSFPVDISVGELVAEDRRTFTIIVRNISDRIAIEESLRKSMKAAEAANQAKSLFLANMSHEIRTPLNSIVGFMHLMLDKSYNDEEKAGFADTIKRNAQVLMQLIDDILDLSKVEAGKIELENMPCSLSDIMRNVRSLMEIKVKEKGISLQVKKEGVVPDVIMTDPTRLQQILINVIGNAVKFTHKGGVTVTLSVRHDADPARHFVEFLVQDTGRGIPVESQENLFSHFSQADSSTTRKYGGTGLGLVLSRHLATAMGGSVELVTSEENLGSTFLITVATPSMHGEFDISKIHSADLGWNPTQLESRLLSGVRALVVDDSPDNQILLSQILGLLGTQVTVADNGNDAIQEALRQSYDIILMDMQMPVMDGYTATRELRKQGYHLPILAVSAAAMKEDRELAIRAGCDDHLTKPLNISQLVKKVAMHVPKIVK